MNTYAPSNAKERVHQYKAAFQNFNFRAEAEEIAWKSEAVTTWNMTG